jgi:hypothetical protein
VLQRFTLQRSFEKSGCSPFDVAPTDGRLKLMLRRQAGRLFLLENAHLIKIY